MRIPTLVELSLAFEYALRKYRCADSWEEEQLAITLMTTVHYMTKRMSDNFPAVATEFATMGEKKEMVN